MVLLGTVATTSVIGAVMVNACVCIHATRALAVTITYVKSTCRVLADFATYRCVCSIADK